MSVRVEGRVHFTTPNIPAAPVASNDTATVDFDDTVTISVLNNDSGNSLSIQSIDTSGTTGTATQSGGNIIYDTNGQFSALAQGSTDTDSFNYTIVDPFNQTDSATVNITVENPVPTSGPPGLDGSFFVGSEDSFPQGVTFNPTGSRMFVVGRGFDTVYQYDLTTNFDVTTATFVQSFSVTSEDNRPQGVAFNPTGNRMFVTGSGSDSVHQYNLGTNFDVTTATFTAGDSFDVSSEDGFPADVTFNPNGSRMFVAGRNSDSVHQYNLGTNFDVTTATFVQSLDVSSQDTGPQGVAFNPTGSRMFVSGTQNDRVYQYNLGTNFDVTTATFLQSFDVSSEDGFPTGVAFNDTGSRMFVVGNQGDRVHQYNLGTPFDISTI